MSLMRAVQVREPVERGEERHLRRARLGDVGTAARDGGVADAVELDVPADELHVDVHAGLALERLDDALRVLDRLRAVVHDPQADGRALLQGRRLRALGASSWSCRRSSLHRPQRSEPTAAAAIHATTVNLLRTILSPPTKTILVACCLKVIVVRGDHLLSNPGGRCGGGRAHDELDGKRDRLRGRDVRGHESRERTPASAPRRALSWRRVVSGGLDVAGELDVVEADDRDVARDDRPRSATARIAPRAMRSEAQTTAVGGSSRSSRRFIACWPDST